MGIKRSQLNIKMRTSQYTHHTTSQRKISEIPSYYTKNKRAKAVEKRKNRQRKTRAGTAIHRNQEPQEDVSGDTATACMHAQTRATNHTCETSNTGNTQGATKRRDDETPGVPRTVSSSRTTRLQDKTHASPFWSADSLTSNHSYKQSGQLLGTKCI